MTEPSDSPPRAKRASYKIAGPQTWALAQEFYLAGLPAPEVAKRLGISVHALRKRATRDGWTRRAHAELVLDVRLPSVGGDRRGSAEAAPDRAPLTADAAAEAEPAAADPGEAAAMLARRAAGLAQAGRADEALRLLKTAEALRRAGEAATNLPAAVDEAEEDEPPPSYPPGVRPDALDRFLEWRTDDPWEPPPRTREEAIVVRLLARLGKLPGPGGGVDALQRADACFALFEAAEQRAAAEVRALPWGWSAGE